MKTTFMGLGVVAGLAMMANAGAAAETYAPKLVGSSYEEGYIPDGFDTNDHVQLVGEGTFNDTCFKPAPPRVKIDHEARVVEIEPQAYLYEGICLMVLVRWDQPVDLGLMKAGDYLVIQNDARKRESQLGKLRIRVAANSTPDDYLYAPISEASIEQRNGKSFVRVKGEFTNSCMRLADVMVSAQPKVVVVQPIAEITTPGDCISGNFPFERRVELPAMKKGRYLLHVRSMNAKAVNTLFDL